MVIKNMDILLVTFGVGLFFVIGTFISLVVKDKKNLISFSLGISFIVMIILVITDILPECLELFSDYKFLAIGGGILIVIGILMLLDKLVPHHHNHNAEDDYNHLIHIGVMTSLAIIIHNVVEGIGLGLVVQTGLKAGLIYALGVGLHNLPFGIKISAMLASNKKKMWIYISLLTLSTFVGGVLVFIFKDMLSDFLLGSLLSVTIGMIIYIVLFELLTELKENFNKYAVMGVFVGFILMIIGTVI